MNGQRCRPPGATGCRLGTATLWLIIVALLAAGCSSAGADWPDLTADEVQQLQDDYARTSFQAMRTRDPELLAEVEGGPLLQRDLASLELLDRVREPKKAEEFTYPESVGYPVRSRAGHDQQHLVTVSEYSNASPDWRNLGLYVRGGPAAPWLRTFTGGLYAADVPRFHTEEPLTPIAPDADGYLATPSSMPAIVAKALQDPESDAAQMFSASEVRKRYADDLAAHSRQAAGVGTVTREYQPGSFMIAVQVEGGYLVLGSFTFTETVTADPGEHVSFDRKSRQHRLYPGKYDSTASTFGAMFAAVVPREGKIRLVSGEERQTDLVAE